MPTSQTAPSAADIARMYSAAIDSVNLINSLATLPNRTAADTATIRRNTDHLKIMLAKPFWTTENLAPLQAASTVV